MSQRKVRIDIVRECLIANLCTHNPVRDRKIFMKLRGTRILTRGIPYVITRKVTPLMCKGRYTPSSRAIAAPKECPVMVTFLAECAEIAVFTAARTAVAVLRNG